MLRKLFLNNINYTYTCIISHRMLTTKNKNTDNSKCFVMLLSVSDLIDVILYRNANNNCKINNIHINS
jgi:hypothetical protein